MGKKRLAAPSTESLPPPSSARLCPTIGAADRGHGLGSDKGCRGRIVGMVCACVPWAQGAVARAEWARRHRGIR